MRLKTLHGAASNNASSTHFEARAMKPTARHAFAAAALLAAASTATQAQDAPSDTVRRAVHVCTSCHGEGGRSTTAANPSLAGQHAQYLEQQLRDFRSQSRSEANLKAYMWGVSALLDDATIQGLAQYYAAQQPAAGRAGAPKLVAAGRRIYEKGLPDRGVLACAGCHGNDAEGQAGFPRLAGQQAAYLEGQLRLLRTTPLRPHGVLMKGELRRMTDPEIKAVAAYVQSR